jgi:hypothetical protein
MLPSLNLDMLSFENVTKKIKLDENN